MHSQNVTGSLPHLVIQSCTLETNDQSPLNEISELANFNTPPMSSLSSFSRNHSSDSFIEPTGILYPFPRDGVASWREVEPAVMGFQQPVTTGHLLVQDQEESNYSSIYPQPTFPPAPVISYTGSSLDVPRYALNFNGPYSPASMMMPTTPSTVYSSQEFLSPWIHSGDISSTPTTPLTMQPVPCAPQEPSMPAQPAEGLTYQEQVTLWKNARELPLAGGATDFIPQRMYKPHTTSDIKRYIEEVALDHPILFWMTGPEECGIPLIDALHSRTRRLRFHDKEVFEGRGPSVSIRLEWPGYRQWSRQIPTKDFKSPPRPINMTKLCKNVAKCVQRFINERQHCDLEDGANPRWRIGQGPHHNGIKLEDLILVSLHHVSMGSWEPQLRLRPRLR